MKSSGISASVIRYSLNHFVFAREKQRVKYDCMRMISTGTYTYHYEQSQHMTKHQNRAKIIPFLAQNCHFSDVVC